MLSKWIFSKSFCTFCASSWDVWFWYGNGFSMLLPYDLFKPFVSIEKGLCEVACKSRKETTTLMWNAKKSFVDLLC